MIRISLNTTTVPSGLKTCQRYWLASQIPPIFSFSAGTPARRFPGMTAKCRNLRPVVFRTLLFLGIAFALPAGAQDAPATLPRWEKEIRAFEAAAKTNPPPANAILFIGSSSVRMWQSLAQDFPEHKVINRGFGGSQIADSVEFADRIVVPLQPRLVVLYAGGNDINAGKSPERVFADFQAFVAKIRAGLPNAKLAYLSSAPNPARWAQIDKVRTLNTLIREFIAKDGALMFIDVHARMLGPDGQPLPDIYLKDRLHMNEKGYAIWKEVVGPYLK